MKHLSLWSWYWAGWLAAFLIPELWFVFTYPQGTLSDNVWALEDANLRHPFDFGNWTPVHWIVFLVVVGLFGWLAVHLPFGLAR